MTDDVQSLLNICVEACAVAVVTGLTDDARARRMLAGEGDAADAAALRLGCAVPRLCDVIGDDRLGLRIWQHCQRLGLPSHPAARLRVAAAFLGFWQPQSLKVEAPSSAHHPPPGGQPPPPDVALALHALQPLAPSLCHLAVHAAQLRSLEWAAHGFTAMTCLSLRGCHGVDGAALVALAACPAMRALDCADMAGLDDSAGLALVQLSALEVLDLSHTRCGDATVEALTHGARVRQWSSSTGQPPAANLQQQWPLTRIRRWHLAMAKFTGASAGALMVLPGLDFLDLRGSGVWQSQLIPLQSRFALRVVQGAVLARSAALAAAAVPYRLFVCVCTPAGGPPRLVRQQRAVQEAWLGWLATCMRDSVASAWPPSLVPTWLPGLRICSVDGTPR